MNFYVNQSICIQVLRVNTMSNSSILQIGNAGMIKGLSNNFNTGGFTGPAPEATGVPQTTVQPGPSTGPLVPLAY